MPLGPMVYPDNINSLTGLPYPDDAAKNRRNLIVKVQLYARCPPAKWTECGGYCV